MAKYIINIPEQIAEASTDYMKKVGMSIEPYTEPDRKAIEDEVWNFVQKLLLPQWNGGLTFHELRECYGNEFLDTLVKLTYQEAKTQYEKWKNEQDEKIKVGDECLFDGRECIVTYRDKKICGVMFNDGMVYEGISIDSLKKTNRHFIEIADLLKKMKEK